MSALLVGYRFHMLMKQKQNSTEMVIRQTVVLVVWQNYKLFTIYNSYSRLTCIHLFVLKLYYFFVAFICGPKISCNRSGIFCFFPLYFMLATFG